MWASFKFHQIKSPSFGMIYRPYALVFLKSKDGADWVPVEMVVDTGADYTILPKKYLPILGYDAAIDCEPEITYGVGGPETVYLLRKIRVKLDKWEKDIPVGFLERDDVPALFGRHMFMELMKTTFAKHVVMFE